MTREDSQAAAAQKRKAEEVQKEKDRVRKSWRAFLDEGVRWMRTNEALEIARARGAEAEAQRSEALAKARLLQETPRTPSPTRR